MKFWGRHLLNDLAVFDTQIPFRRQSTTAPYSGYQHELNASQMS